MTIPTRTVIRPTRRVRDIIRGDRFVVTTRFPGGREIEHAKAKTRQRAREKAEVVVRPQTSPTASGGSGGSFGNGGQPREIINY